MGKLIELPRAILRVPEPLANSVPLAVFELRESPAVAPVAKILELTLMLLLAVNVKLVFAPQVTLSFTLTLPAPPVVPALERMVTLLSAKLDARVTPEILLPAPPT